MTDDTPLLGGSTRRTPRLLLGLAALFMVGSLAAARHEQAHPVRYPDAMAWRTLEEGAAESAREGRLVLYEFTADWCGPCQKLQREVFANEKRARTIAALVVPVRIEDVEQSAEAVRLREQLVITSYPTLVAVSADGTFTRRLAGYAGPASVMVFIRDAEATWRARR